MRHRIQKDVSVSQTGQINYHQYNSSGAFVGDLVIDLHVFNLYTEYADMLDEKHFDYAKRINAGELIIGNLLVDKHKLQSGGGVMTGQYHLGLDSTHWEVSSPSVTLWALAGHPVSYVDVLPSTIDVEAVKLHAVSKIDAGQYDFIEDLLSLRENVRLLRDPLQGFRDVQKHYYRRKNAKAGAAGWAFYRFAATPFLRSASDLYESFHVKNKSVDPFVRLRSTSVKNESTGKSDVVTSADSAYSYQRNFNTSTTVRCGVYYKAKTLRGGLSYKYGIRLTDLPAGIWAVVPYSFMIDRIYSISNLVRAVTNLSNPNLIVEGGYVTTTVNVINQIRVSAVANPQVNWTYNVSGDQAVYSKTSIQRETWLPSLTDLPQPSVNLKGLVDDSTKILDLTALILQRSK